MGISPENYHVEMHQVYLRDFDQIPWHKTEKCSCYFVWRGW